MQIKTVFTKNILNKCNLPIGDFSVNPYIGCAHACKYCYACYMKRFTNHSEEWGTFLDVKMWDDIKHAEKYANKEILIGSATDPYNQYEKEYKRTRAFLEQMRNSHAKISILTKSHLILRDLDLIKEYNDPLVSFSINTLDEDFKNDMDKASLIKERIEAMKIFHDNNIRTTCFISPIFPGITNVEQIIEACAPYADYIWLENLNLRGEFKYPIFNYIKEKYPDLLPIYEEIYIKGDLTYWQCLSENIEQYAKEKAFEYLIDDKMTKKPTKGKPIIINYFYHSQIKKSAQKRNNI